MEQFWYVIHPLYKHVKNKRKTEVKGIPYFTNHSGLVKLCLRGCKCLPLNLHVCHVSPVAHVCRLASFSICSNVYGGWFKPHARHSVRMTYRPSAAVRLLGRFKISHNKFLRANK